MTTDPPEILTGRPYESINAGVCKNGAGIWFQTRTHGYCKWFLFNDSVVESVCRRLLMALEVAK